MTGTGVRARAADKQASQAAPSTPQVDASQYVGADTCKTCHEEVFTGFEKTPHWKTTYDTHRGVAYQGCEACHGPGKAHVDGGGDKSKIFIFPGAKAEEISKRCLTCHEFGEEHANFARSIHSKNNVSCIDCHSPHHAKQERALLKQPQPQLCYSCHLNVRADFNRPFRHRVNEGLIQCTDCHNQHGGFLSTQLRSTVTQDQVCFKCHTEKAGPFTYEHFPVRSEGCVACHTPHGSSNPRLLTRSSVNVLCLECHTITEDLPAPAAPSFHNQAQKYQACTLCHTQIHGSNIDRTFFK
jgi:DmsE family decaheme c-type cytochrome